MIRPVITEKSMQEAGRGRYTFAVPLNYDKQTIKKAVEKQFSVDVVSLTTTVNKGKTKRVGQRRLEVKQSPRKKAVVVVKSGQKIGVFDIGA